MKETEDIAYLKTTRSLPTIDVSVPDWLGWVWIWIWIWIEMPMREQHKQVITAHCKRPVGARYNNCWVEVVEC